MTLAYLRPVTKEKAAECWGQIAQEELETARLLHSRQLYRQALVHCALAVRSALRAVHVRRLGCGPSSSWDLVSVAQAVSSCWGPTELKYFRTFSKFLAEPDHVDPTWLDKYATRKIAGNWIERAGHCLAVVS